MHPDLERSQFIDHIQRLQQELERLRLDPGRREMGQIAKLKERLERMAADNATLRARLNGRDGERAKRLAEDNRQLRTRLAHRTLKSGEVLQVAEGLGCRNPHGNLGSLSYAEAVEMHEAQAASGVIAKAAGVALCTLSNWRKANGWEHRWVRRVACGSDTSEAQ